MGLPSKWKQFLIKVRGKFFLFSHGTFTFTLKATKISPNFPLEQQFSGFMSAATGVLVELIFHKCEMSSCINQVNAIYPISKFETNFVTSVQLKIFPLIHSKSGTIPTSRQNVQNLGNLNKKESTFSGIYCKIFPS